MPFEKGKAPRGSKPRGVPNKITTEFRATVQSLIDDNNHKFALWLKLVAEGHEGMGIKPDPGRALDLMIRLAEFAAPKLARMEHVGEGGGPVTTRIELVAPQISRPVELVEPVERLTMQ